VSNGSAIARESRAVTVWGWEPGNGSRLDLVIAPRAGGGWCVTWPEAGLVGLVRYFPGDTSVALEGRGKAWSESDRRAVEALLLDLLNGGTL